MVLNRIISWGTHQVSICDWYHEFDDTSQAGSLIPWLIVSIDTMCSPNILVGKCEDSSVGNSRHNPTGQRELGNSIINKDKESLSRRIQNICPWESFALSFMYPSRGSRLSCNNWWWACIWHGDHQMESCTIVGRGFLWMRIGRECLRWMLTTKIACSKVDGSSRVTNCPTCPLSPRIRNMQLVQDGWRIQI